MEMKELDPIGGAHWQHPLDLPMSSLGYGTLPDTVLESIIPGEEVIGKEEGSVEYDIVHPRPFGPCHFSRL